jgi:hypothetical protein
MSDNLPVSVNYTNKDFYSLRDDLITRVQARVPNWSGSDPADFGLALVEAFAYIGDITNYYIDRAANEATLSTAVQRQSILDLASIYGYVPYGYVQASVDITFKNNSSQSVLIPVGTQLSTSITINDTTTTLYFTLIEDVSLVSGASDVGTALHGQDISTLVSNQATSDTDIAGELLGYSTGLPNQSFTLAKTPVAEATIEVYVFDGNQYIFWTEVDHLSDYGSSDTVYTVRTDANDVVTVTFGDNVTGAIPNTTMPIKAVYVNGGGVVGNISAGQQFVITYVPGVTGNLISGISATNAAAAFGGQDPESNDSIRANAPVALRTISRAVTLSDYADLALSVDQVGKTLALATQPNSVLIYMGPSVTNDSTDFYPGYDPTNTTVTSSWQTLQASVLDYLSDKTQIGVSVTVSPPTYIPVKIQIQYRKLTGYTHDQVINNIKYGVIYGFGYNFLSFGEILYPEQIEASVINAPGVLSLKAISLYRNGGSNARTNLVPVNGELFVFTDTNTAVYPIASLATLTTSVGTLSPIFASHVFGYTIAVPNGTTSTVLTPTAWDNTCTLVVTSNGTPVSPSAGAYTITTAVGTTTVVVKVTTADTLDTNTYTIKITRAS